MMSPEEVGTVGLVYRRLIAGEDRGWIGIDTHLEALSWLEDDQVIREAQVAFTYHGVEGKNPRCPSKHDIAKCFIPQIIEAVGSILSLHHAIGAEQLHINNRYILECYLALDQERMIVTD